MQLAPAPHPASLCQPNPERSCGACCGLYNSTSDRDQILESLHERTLAFRALSTPLDVTDLKAFRTRWEPSTDSRLMGELQSCPFLGFLDQRDPKAGRIGCLVHPLQNNGFDGRDCGVFDRHLCEDYLCASYGVLNSMEKWLVTSSPLDSFTYGLVITDPLLIRTTLNLIATELGAFPTRSLLSNAEFQKRFAEFCEWKHTWPFQDHDGFFGPIRAGENLETPRRTPPSQVLGVAGSPLDELLLCFGSKIDNVTDLEKARSLLDQAIKGLAVALVE